MSEQQNSLLDGWDPERHHSVSEHRALLEEFRLMTESVPEEQLASGIGVHLATIRKWRKWGRVRLNRSTQARVIEYLRRRRQ